MALLQSLVGVNQDHDRMITGMPSTHLSRCPAESATWKGRADGSFLPANMPRASGRNDLNEPRAITSRWFLNGKCESIKPTMETFQVYVQIYPELLHLYKPLDPTVAR
jgi:hypothetical protein